jgi:hypothetical protein
MAMYSSAVVQRRPQIPSLMPNLKPARSRAKHLVTGREFTIDTTCNCGELRILVTVPDRRERDVHFTTLLDFPIPITCGCGDCKGLRTLCAPIDYMKVQHPRFPYSRSWYPLSNLLRLEMEPNTHKWYMHCLMNTFHILHDTQRGVQKASCYSCNSVIFHLRVENPMWVMQLSMTPIIEVPAPVGNGLWTFHTDIRWDMYHRREGQGYPQYHQCWARDDALRKMEMSRWALHKDKTLVDHIALEARALEDGNQSELTVTKLPAMSSLLASIAPSLSPAPQND